MQERGKSMSMSDDSDASLPLPGSPPAGPIDHPDEDSGSDHHPLPPIPLSKKIILQMSSPEEVVAPPSPNLPLDEIPYPTELTEKMEPEPEVEIPLPPDSSDSKYSPSQASAEDASPASETQQKKTVAVLGRAQAMKRLKAFSAAKLAATSTTSGSGMKKSPLKGVSVFSGKSSSDSKGPPLAIASIKEEETKMREILAMNSLLNEKLKTVHAITGSIPGPGPATAIVKPTLLNSEFRSNSSDPLDKSDVASKNEDKITSFHVKKQLKNIRRKRASSSSSQSRSRSKSPGIKRRGPERRSRSRDRDKDRDRDRDSYRRDRERDRLRERDRENERKRTKRSRSRSKNREHDRRRSKSPRSKEKPRRRSRTRSRERKRRSRSRERKRTPSRSVSHEKEKEGKRRDKSPVGREVKRKSVSPLPLREKKQKSLSPPPPLRKSMSRSVSIERRKSRSRSKSVEIRAEIKKKSRSRSREREGKSRRKSPSKHKKKDKDRDRERDREREKEKLLEKERREKEEKKEAERRRERERLEAVERELDKVRTTRMPIDWKEYKKFQYSPDNVREVWSSIYRDSRARSRSRSSSRSPSRAKELPSSPTFSKTLIQSPKLIKTVQVELRNSIKREYPVDLLKTTRQKPPLEYGCNRLSVRGYYKSRDVFKEESPELVKCVETIMNPEVAAKAITSPPDLPKVQPWFVEHAPLFCPSEGSKGIVISHLYSDEEMEEAPPIRSKLSAVKAEKPSKKAEVSVELSKSVPVLASAASTATATTARPSSVVEPMEEDYSTESSQSQDSVPSPLLKTRYGADLPPPPPSSVVTKIPEEAKPLSDEEDEEEDEEEENVEQSPVLPKPAPPPEERKLKTKEKKKDKKKKKKKESKKHHRRHRKDSKKYSKSDEEEDSDEKVPESESSPSDDGSKSKAVKRKKSRKDEEEVLPSKASSKVVLEDSKKKSSKVTSSSGKTSKKHSKKSRKGKYSDSDASEHSSSSEDSKESSSSSSGSESEEKEKSSKKKKKRNHKKKRDRKEDKDESSDEEPQDRGDKGGAGGSSGRSGGGNDRSRSHRRDKDKDRERERDRRRSRDRDRDRDRSDRKKRRHDGFELGTLEDSAEDSQEDSSSSTSSSSSYSSNSNTSSSYSSANEDDENASELHHPNSQFQLALQMSKIQQIGLEEKTENDSQIISKLLIQIENDEIRESLKKVGGEEKYDPFLDMDAEEDSKMTIPIVVNSNKSGRNFNSLKVEPELSGAGDLLKTFDNDPLLQLVMTDQNLSAENLLAQIYEPDPHDVAGDVKNEVKPTCPVIPLLPPVPPPPKKKVEAFKASEPTRELAPKERTEAVIPKVEVIPIRRSHRDYDAGLGPDNYADKFERSPSYEHFDDNRRNSEDIRRLDRPKSGRSYSRSYSRSRSRSRSRSFSPSSRRQQRSRKVLHDRRYHPYHDRHDRYRSTERRERYADGHRGRDIREREHEETYSRYERHRRGRDGRDRDRERQIDFRHRDRSLEDYDLGHQSRRYERIGRSEKDGVSFENQNHYQDNREEEDRLVHEDLIEKPITTICNVAPSVSTQANLMGAAESPPLRLNVADSTISDSDLADNIALGFVDSVDDNRASRSNLKEIIPQSDSDVASALELEGGNTSAPGYVSPPKRLSLDERLEMEMGIKLREEVQQPSRSSLAPSAFPSGQGAFCTVPGGNQAPKSESGWLPQVPVQGVQTVAYEAPSAVPRQSQAIPLGDLIQVLPGQMLDRSFTVTKQNSKLNPFEVQQTATQVIRKVGDEMDPKKCVNIKVPVLPFKIPVFGHPDLEAVQAAEQEKENRMLLKQQEREKKRLEKKKRQHEKRKQLLKKKMLKKKEMMAKRKLAMEAAKREREQKALTARESNSVASEVESSAAMDPEELKLLKEALTEVPPSSAEDAEGLASVSTETELIRDQILPVDDMNEADEQEEDTFTVNEPASPKQPSIIDLPNTAVIVKVVVPKKGILYMTGLKKEKSSKGVKFADGVLPGHGSSRSEGEDIHSPPPGQENVVKKKKKVKVSREKKKPKTKPVVEVDPNAPKLPPPPPPKEPYPYCPLGILYQFNPPYAIVYAQTLAELGYEVTFTPSMETPKDFAGEQLQGDESHSVQFESLNQSIPSNAVLMSELGSATPAELSASWPEPDSKDRGRRKRKHREHKDIDLKPQSASLLDPRFSRHSSHRHKEHKVKLAHAQRIPTIVSSVPNSPLPNSAIPPHDFHPVDGGRNTPRILVKDAESDSHILLRENKNLISLSSHHEENSLVSAMQDTNPMKTLPFDETTTEITGKVEIPVESKRIENHRFKHHENHRVRSRHNVDNNRILNHNHYENHRVEHHKLLENHQLDSSKPIENHRLERKRSDNNRRNEYGHSDWKNELGMSDITTSGNPNLIQISPSKPNPMPKTSPCDSTKSSKKAFTESFVEVARTPELESEKVSEFQAVAPIPIVSRAKPIKIKMKSFIKISDASVPPVIRPVPVSKTNSVAIPVSPTPAVVVNSVDCKEMCSSPLTPPSVLPSSTVSVVSSVVTTVSPPPSSTSPIVQIPVLHAPTYDCYNQVIPAKVPTLSTSPVPPTMSPSLSPRLPCGIDLSRPPPAFSPSPTTSVNAGAPSLQFAAATRVPGVRITHSSPGQSRRPQHKGSRS